MIDVARVRYIHPDQLKQFVRDVLLGLGASDEHAAITADALISSDLRGVESHGVANLWRYIRGLQEGWINARPQYRILSQTPAVMRFDADAALGFATGVWAMEKAMEKAGQLGVGVVSVRNSTHFGMAAYYSMIALKRDMIGVTMTNSGTLVAPTFGRLSMLGTNPIAVAAPAGGARPFVLDMATSVVPQGKISKYDWLGKAIPDGWVIDETGNTLTDTHKALHNLLGRKGGGLLPLGGEGEDHGGHKGYGLVLMVEILSGILSGSLYADLMYPKTPDGKQLPPDTGHLFMALNVSAFRPLDEFKASMDDLLQRVKNSPKAEGHSRIYIHGEKEFEEEERRRRDGIPLHETVVQNLRELTAPLGVKMP
jgi:LDH2 family malate/lactate/ureidoglycolate dehydrogenase